MADIRKTQKGNEIDIDLIRMKAELEKKELNTINIKRENEINSKRRRSGSSTKINEMLANQELVRHKLREQKKDLPEEEVQAVKEEVIDKEKPEITGRRIVKK